MCRKLSFDLPKLKSGASGSCPLWGPQISSAFRSKVKAEACFGFQLHGFHLSLLVLGLQFRAPAYKMVEVVVSPPRLDLCVAAKVLGHCCLQRPPPQQDICACALARACCVCRQTLFGAPSAMVLSCAAQRRASPCKVSISSTAEH